MIRLHDLRHTNASLALSAGVPLKIVSERLGHSQTAITADLYTHVNYGVGRSAARQIAALLRPTNGEGDAVPSDFLAQRPLKGSDGGTDERADLSTSKGSADVSAGQRPDESVSRTSALGGIRTPNLLIRSQMLYPLSYKRSEKVDRRVYPPGTDGGRREGMSGDRP